MFRDTDNEISVRLASPLRPTPGVRSSLPIPAELPILIPVDNATPRHDGAWCSQQRSFFMQNETQAKAVSGDFYTFMVLDASAEVPTLAYRIIGPSV